MKNKNFLWFSVLFWAGFLLLAVDLLTYATQIKYYFTTLGIVLLFVSAVLLIISYFVRMKK